MQVQDSALSVNPVHPTLEDEVCRLFLLLLPVEHKLPILQIAEIVVIQALDTGGSLESPEKAMEEPSLGDENAGVEKDGGGVLSLDEER